MKLLLAKDTNLQTTFEFDIWKKAGSLNVIHGHLYNAKKIGVYLSGGPDSAALLCLILKEIIDKNKQDIPIHCFIVDKNEGQVHFGIDTIKEVEKLFNIHISYSIENHQPDENFPSRLGSKTYRHISDNNPNTIFYQGINNPPSSDIKTFNSDVPRSYGDKTVTMINGLMYCFPFLFLHKPQILDIFYQLNCESVIKYTQSCYMWSTGSCGKCYSCEERQWGFEILDKQDPIINNKKIKEK